MQTAVSWDAALRKAKVHLSAITPPYRTATMLALAELLIEFLRVYHRTKQGRAHYQHWPRKVLHTLTALELYKLCVKLAAEVNKHAYHSEECRVGVRDNAAPCTCNYDSLAARLGHIIYHMGPSSG